MNPIVDNKPGRRPRKGPAKPSVTSASPGQPPVSARQRELRARMRGEVLPTPEENGPRVVRLRDADATRKRVVQNRRRPNYLGISLSLLFLLSIGGSAVYLLTHPRFVVKDTAQNVRIEGIETVPEVTIREALKPFLNQNLFVLPVERIQRAVAKEPTFATVRVEREWPNCLQVTVSERKPFASVQLPDGSCYTIDTNLVPFRKTEEPEIALPRVLLSSGEKEPESVTLGKTIAVPGLAEVQQCLDWAQAHPEFPIESLTIDPTGKLCLNRVGGMQVRLGSSRDLTRKLESLSLLFQRRPDIPSGTTVAQVNLFASDAPAVLPRHKRGNLEQKPRTKAPGHRRPHDAAPRADRQTGIPVLPTERA